MTISAFFARVFVRQQMGYLRLMTDFAVWIIRGPSLQFVAVHVDNMLFGGSRALTDKTKLQIFETVDIFSKT